MASFLLLEINSGIADQWEVLMSDLIGQIYDTAVELGNWPQTLASYWLF